MAESISIPDRLRPLLTDAMQQSGADMHEVLVDLLERALCDQSPQKSDTPSWDELSPQALVSPKQVSERLLLSKSKLAKLRCSGGGPSFVKLGSRTVVYRVKDVDSYISERVQNSTSEY